MNLRPRAVSRLLQSPSSHPNLLSSIASSRDHILTTIWRPSPNHRPFSSTPHHPSESFYDILSLPPTCSKSDLKKSFYTLSKTTHPDANPSDPTAADRFSKISEAYSTLSDPDRRAKYDRDVLPRHQPRPSQQSRPGSYAGSRPATGLSKRRGTFRGPPPSFYATGGSTPEREAREQAQAEQARQGAFNASNYSDDMGFAFNSKPVYKTQTMEDRRRQDRRQAEMAAAQAYAEEEGDFIARFVAVSVVIGIGVGVGSLIVNMGGGGKGGLVKADGSRRTQDSKPATPS